MRRRVVGCIGRTGGGVRERAVRAARPPSRDGAIGVTTDEAREYIWRA